MRELNGVLSRFNRHSHRRIKQSILLFDRIYCPREPASDLDVVALNDLKFLKERKIIIDSESIVPPLTPIVKFPKKSGPLDATRLMDVVARGLAAEITRRQKGAAVVCPVCELPLPKGFTGVFNGEEPSADTQQVMRVIVEKLPVPGSSSSLEDVLAFKADMRGSKWALQRLLRDLSLKKQTMPEIRDDIEWSLNEYTKSMKLHQLKAGDSFVEVYLIPAVEIVENLVKLNWSQIAKGALSIRKRKIELMDAERSASGREVAFIYEAQKRFGHS
jgi:hypothetical protein